jgi:DNA polymerase theta
VSRKLNQAAQLTKPSVMAAALDHFSDRLIAGARADLLALAKIPFIKSRTA